MKQSPHRFSRSFPPRTRWCELPRVLSQRSTVRSWVVVPHRLTRRSIHHYALTRGVNDLSGSPLTTTGELLTLPRQIARQSSRRQRS